MSIIIKKQRIGKMATSGGNGTLQGSGYDLLNIVSDYKVNEEKYQWAKSILELTGDDNMTRWLHLDKHKEFDVLTYNNNFVSCSGIFNGGRYPDNHFRLANRMWVQPEYRRNSSRFMHVDKITRVQYERIKSELDVVFVSLKTNKNFRVIKRISETIDSSLTWNLNDRYYQVVPGQYNKKCFQNIIWASLHGNAIDLPHISEEEYEKLPE